MHSSKASPELSLLNISLYLRENRHASTDPSQNLGAVGHSLVLYLPEGKLAPSLPHQKFINRTCSREDLDLVTGYRIQNKTQAFLTGMM
jgi:hypothetical protein